MSNITFKYLKKSDIRFIIEEIEKKSFNDAWSVSMLEEELDNDIASYILILLDDSIIGYAGYWKVLDEADIMRIAIVPEFRGRGFSKALLARVIEHAKENGIKDVTLEVRKSNEVAINLYKSFGFTIEAIRKGYYPDGEDAVLMWLYNI